MKIFAVKTFVNCPETAKFLKLFPAKDSHYTTPKGTVPYGASNVHALWGMAQNHTVPFRV